MIATKNAVAPRTERVGRHLRVLHDACVEHALKDATSPEIDLVTTPMGDPVAMVHCNNCTSDINGWAGRLAISPSSSGLDLDRREVFSKLFESALSAKDAGRPRLHPVDLR